MGVLAVKRAAGQRLVEVLEPVGADKIGVVRDGPEIARIGGAALAFATDADEAFPEQPAIDRAEMEFADQRGFAEGMKLRPFGSIVGPTARSSSPKRGIAELRP